MRNRIWMLCVLPFILVLFSGCAVNNFFDVNSTMAPPRLPEEESCIDNTVKNYLGEEIKFCQLVVGERYSSVVKYNFNETEYMVVFCKTENTSLQSHIMLLEKAEDNWCVKDDMVRDNIEFIRAQIINTKSDMPCELIVEGIDVNTKVTVMFSLCIRDNVTMQIID